MYETEDIVIAETLGDSLVTIVAVTSVLTLSTSCFSGIGLKPLIDSFKNL